MRSHRRLLQGCNLGQSKRDSIGRIYPLPISINRFLLEHDYVPLFRDYLWLLLCYNERIKYLQQISYDSQSLKYLLSCL